MNYIEAPTIYEGASPSLFLAGGLTGTQDWQAEIARLLTDTPWTLLNPRLRTFRQTPAAAAEQIRWEYDHLRRATARLFWFPPQTLCPIALLELGAWSRGPEPLLVGAHPEYQRCLDVRVQLSLARPDVTLVSTLVELAAQAVKCLGRLN